MSERYTADAAYEVGTVLIFGGDKEVTVTTKTYDRRVAGVVAESTGTDVVLASSGRAKCKVVGPVRRADVIVTSAVAGYAQADTPSQHQPVAGRTIGKALEDFDGESGIIEIAVRPN